MLLKAPDNSILCDRCHNLKSQNRLIEQKLKESDHSSDKLRAGQPVNLSLLTSDVVNFNREGIIEKLFKQIYNRSILIYVLDITNFEGS